MRLRKSALVALGGSAIGLLLATIVWLSRTPLEFRVESAETAGIVDDNGAPQWLVTVRIQNRGSKAIEFDTQRAKVMRLAA